MHVVVNYSALITQIKPFGITRIIKFSKQELKFMNAYLSTCTSSRKPNVKREFDKILYPRTYLYEDVDKVSI